MIKQDKVNLQLTLKKTDIKKINEISNYLSKKLNMNLTKSQTIQYLINKFNIVSADAEKEIKKAVFISEPKASQQKPIERTSTREYLKPSVINAITKEQNDIAKSEYSAKLQELKTRLQITIKELAEMLNINFETFKSYYKGKRYPNEQNKAVIQSYFDKYGIK